MNGRPWALQESVSRDDELAPAEIEMGGRAVLQREIVSVQRVDHETALLLLTDQSRGAQDAKMVGDVDDLYFKQVGQLSHVLGTRPEALDDPDPIRFRDRLKQIGTFHHLRLIISHAHNNLRK